MKRTLSLVLAVIMLLSVCTFGSLFTTTASAAGIGLGDPNADSVISAKDSLTLKKYVVGIETVIVEANGDLDGDGKITTKDCKLLSSYISGAIDSFNGAAAGRPVGSLKIAGNDISTYDIVSMRPTDDLLRECYSYSVRQLRNMIADAAGYTLNVCGNSNELDTNGRFSDEEGWARSNQYRSSDKAHHIYIVWQPKTGELGEQGYRWVVDENDNFYIYGGSHAGCLNGVNDFLYKYIGYRIFEDGEDWYVPHAFVNVPSGLDFKFVPQLRHRDVHTGLWIKSYGGNGTVEYLNSYNHCNAHEDKAFNQSPKFGWGYGNCWVHAHSFAYIFSGIDYSQPCLSNGYNQNTAESWALNLIRERTTQENPERVGYNLRRVSISWNDNTNYCECSNCMAIYRREQSIAGAIVPFANGIAETVNAYYPGVHIYYIAYNTARIPPKYARPNEYCDIEFCWNGCNNHTFDSNECDDYGDTKGWTNWKERYYFEFWAKITHNLECWYYASTFNWNIGECPNTLNIRSDIRYWAEHGVVGVYAEFVSDDEYNFEGLKHYLMARCQWDPYMSEAEYQQMIDEYLEYKFGAGWRYIKEYLYMNDEAGNRNGCFTNNYDWPGDEFNCEYFITNYDKMVGLMNSAKALTLNGTQSNNIEKLSVQMHWMALTGAILKYGNNAIANNSTWSARYDEMYNYFSKYDYQASIYGNPRNNPQGGGYNKYATPMQSFLDIASDGRWITWYRGEGRTLPRDDQRDSENKYYFIDTRPTKSNNPLATWEP